MLSSSLGLAKCLKYGIARPFPPGGPLDGLLTWRFLFVFLASHAVFWFRSALVCYFGAVFSINSATQSSLPVPISLIITTFIWIIPPLLLSLFSTLNFRDRFSLKILYRYPSLIILPMVTFFTFSRHNIIGRENNRVTFSWIFTGVNMSVTTLSYFVLVSYSDPFNSSIREIRSFHYESLGYLVSGILFTTLFLFTDKLCCCCCDPKEQLSVYDPHLDKRFILVEGQVKEDPEDEIETPEDDVETGTNSCCIVPEGEENNIGEQTEA